VDGKTMNGAQDFSIKHAIRPSCLFAAVGKG
jgi:hypothetical protein